METAVAMLEEGCPLDAGQCSHSPAQGGNVDFVRELVVRGCDVNAVDAKSVVGGTLH